MVLVNYDRIGVSEGIDPIKSNNSNKQFLIEGSNLQILSRFDAITVVAI